MIINNNISNDDYTTRAERIQLLSDNIDTFAVEIGVSGARLADAQNADAQWEDVCAKCVVESGQKDEAYETFHEAMQMNMRFMPRTSITHSLRFCEKKLADSENLITIVIQGKYI